MSGYMKSKFLASLIAIFLCLISTSSANESHEALHKKLLHSLYGKEVTPFAVISIPQSSMPVLMNVLQYMANATPYWQPGLETEFDDYYRSLWKNKSCYSFLCTQFCVSSAFESLCNNINLKKIVCIRDLRDVCVSIVYYIQKNGWPGLNSRYPYEWQAFKQLSFDEQLLFVINYDYDSAKIGSLDQFSLTQVAKQTAQYCNKPNVLVCPYENLVGEQGGGTQKAQLATFDRINQFLNLGLSQEKLLEISSKIGNKEQYLVSKEECCSPKIGSWKEVFKEEHKEAFKKKLGWALIYFGYVKDNNW